MASVGEGVCSEVHAALGPASREAGEGQTGGGTGREVSGDQGPGFSHKSLAQSGGLLNKTRWEEWSRPRAVSRLCLEPNLNKLGINRHFRPRGQFKYILVSEDSKGY